MFPDTIRVRVTKQHIALGLRHSCSSCPIAIAVRAVSPVWQAAISVNSFFAAMVGNGKAVSYKLPPEAQVFIRRFDQLMPVEPFEFDMTREVE